VVVVVVRLRRLLGWFFDNAKSARAIGGHREGFEPGSVERGLLALGKLEVQRNRGVDPDAASAIPHVGGLFPRESESLIASQFNDHDDLDVSEDPVFELDLESGISVDNGSQRERAFLWSVPS
jgi:hypothetical protein